MATHSSQPGDGDDNGLISPSQAVANAWAGLQAAPWMNALNSSAGIETLTAGRPLLVQWLDRQNCFYYLVPFNIKDRTLIVVIIDAVTGRFKECSQGRQPGIYPKINASRAEKILKTYLQKHALNDSSPTQAPRLVWKPCEQSQSPYAPLWCIRMGAAQWFVDQDGNVHSRITEIQTKGGGPP